MWISELKSKIKDKIFELLGAEIDYTNEDLMLGEYFNNEILRQYKEIINDINKQLKESLHKAPYGHSMTTVRIENKDMRNAVIELYRKQGFEVTHPYSDGSYIRITFDGWTN